MKNEAINDNVAQQVDTIKKERRKERMCNTYLAYKIYEIEVFGWRQVTTHNEVRHIYEILYHSYISIQVERSCFYSGFFALLY